MNPITGQNKIETIRPSIDNSATQFRVIKCKRCGDEVSSNTRKKMTPCKCGAIEVDGCKEYFRVIGNSVDYEVMQK